MRRRWSPRCRRREPARPLTRGRTYDVQQSRTHRALEFLESPCTNLTHRALPCCPAMRGTWRPFCYYTQRAVPRRRRQHQPCVLCLFTFAYERRSSDLTLPPTRALRGSFFYSLEDMLYTRPSASDYDDWETLYRNPGWGSKDLIPLLRKVCEEED